MTPLLAKRSLDKKAVKKAKLPLDKIQEMKTMEMRSEIHDDDEDGPKDFGRSTMGFNKFDTNENSVQNEYDEELEDEKEDKSQNSQEYNDIEIEIEQPL